MSREVLRHKEFEGCVELKRIRDWFICEFHSPRSPYCTVLIRSTVSVESEGPYTPESLFPESIKVMRGKIASIREAAEALLADSQDLGSGSAPGASAGPDADGDVEMA